MLGILLTAAFAFMTVGRAWLGSLRSVWPSLQLQPEPTLPAPLAPDREPGLLPAPVERLIPPLEALPGTPSGTVESAPPEPAAAEPAAPTAPVPPEPADRPRMSSPPLSGDGQSSVPLLTEPALPGDPAPSEVMTPADLPAPPSTHPAAPEAPPAGEATPAMPPGESDSVFPEE